MKVESYKVVILKPYSEKRIKSFIFESESEAIKFAIEKANKMRSNLVQVFECYNENGRIVEAWAPIFER